MVNCNVPLSDVIYTAGLFDGEGHVGVRGSNSMNGGVGIYIDITNSELFVINWLKEVFGGSIYQNRVYKTGRKITYKWIIYSDSAARILSWLLPYLKIKNEQAILAMEINETKKSGGNQFVSSYTTNENTYRHGLASRIHELNQKGV